MREGPGSFGKGPPTRTSKEFRHRFIIAKDNLNVNSLERKWSPDWPRGKISRKFQYLPELRANKSVQPPSYEYSTIFQNDRQISPGFLPPNQGPWGRNCSGTKKNSATFLAKVTDIPHFISRSRRRCPALTPSLSHICPVYVPLRRPTAPAASGSLPNTSRLFHRERNFQHGWHN